MPRAERHRAARSDSARRTYQIDFPFDGRTIIAEATFVAGTEILVGTHILLEYRLDINFPAGVLQPPLYDPKLDDAPNYGNTGGTIGHELTRGFDDEGRQFDAKGNLRDWWTKDDKQKFEERTKCVSDQYAQYVVVDDVRINSRLTLGEDVADLGGEILAYSAWQGATKDKGLKAVDGLTPEQRFFIGFAQWDDVLALWHFT